MKKSNRAAGPGRMYYDNLFFLLRMVDASVRSAERVFKSTHLRAYCRPIHESHLPPGRTGPGETGYGGTGCVRAPIITGGVGVFYLEGFVVRRTRNITHL